MINRSKDASETITKFLTSVQRNSLKSKNAYESALHHFQVFLEQKYSSQDNKIEVILNLLSKGELNVYELLDDFVANLISINPHLTPASIRLYVSCGKIIFGVL